MSASPHNALSSVIEAVRASLAPPLDKPSDSSSSSSHKDMLADIHALGFEDYKTLVQFLNASITGINDDNKLLLERLVQLLAKLPPQSAQLKALSDGFINQLWTTLDHPPVCLMESKHKYRSADGSYNSIRNPQLGAANTPYARSVKPTVFRRPGLPEPHALFDRLMARGDKFEPHPQGISSMLFYLATIIIHDIFQTSHADWNVNLASSYLDLSPLYGGTDDDVKMMRTFQNGLLKPDCFSSYRILGFPPGCGVFLIMFNRFHNYEGRFKSPKADVSKAEAKQAWAQYDEDLFQTSRLVTCGLYINIIMRDYEMFGTPVPEGVGNHVSAEFNLVYRWHSTISPRDEQWCIKELSRLLKSQDPENVSLEDFAQATKEWKAGLPQQPEDRAFEDMTRLPDGTFPDNDLVRILTESIEDVGGSYGANRVPRCMKAVEILGILQARHWNLGTLNEFRQFVGLSKHTSFEDINPDPAVVASLRQLYDSPDTVEMYPGIVAERTKPPMSPGSGLCGTSTMTMAILSDAVALVRGDRFYTVDYTPKSLTNWGFNEANYDTGFNGGHVMHKLIFRAFPNHFANNSIHAHFPLGLGTRSQYSWAPPQQRRPPIMIRSHKACTQILNDTKGFSVVWGEAMDSLVHNDRAPGAGANFCLSGDSTANRSDREHILKSLYPEDWQADVKAFFSSTSDRLLERHGCMVSGVPHTFEVDIVRDVIALATTHFSAALWSLPIKTEANPRGIYPEHQLYLVLLACFGAIFFDADIANSHKLRTQSHELAQQLGKLVILRVKRLSVGGGIFDAMLDTFKESVASLGHVVSANSTKKTSSDRNPEWPTLARYGDHMIQRMLSASGAKPEHLVWGSILPASVSACANQTEVLSQAIDFYLGDGRDHLPTMYDLAHQDTDDAEEKLQKYLLEGIRLRGGTVKDFAPSKPDPSDPSGLNPVPNANPGGSSTTHQLTAGTPLLLNLTAANHDGTAFPDPETVRLDRPIKNYLHFGWGPHLCLGQDMSVVGLAVVFKKIVGLKNLRRAPGISGELKSFPLELGSGWTGLRTYMTPDQSSFWPLPSTMRVHWDE
ncbi:hypothetical protein KVR01_009088 [Diaporthe batatas]|uniref:uncharacterized protein n=1 Tax=Diaporthe batatas TaxID=748121 RepID=UPI001D036455|nr:uncharacterized protein KVR01_009088 [Diaporthe batatas]KAG8160824.1 hypothetical protein KVR01_009088 [Diaporthe batatas]